MNVKQEEINSVADLMAFIVTTLAAFPLAPFAADHFLSGDWRKPREGGD